MMKRMVGSGGLSNEAAPEGSARGRGMQAGLAPDARARLGRGDLIRAGNDRGTGRYDLPKATL